MKFNTKEIKEKIKKDRDWFVRYWAEYVRTHPDKVWSRQQKVLIDSQIANSRYFYKHNAPKSMFGAHPGLAPFSEEDEADFHEL